MTKRCTVCKQEKPLDAFFDDHEMKGGKRSRCKICHNKLAKTYASRNAKTVTDEQLTKMADRNRPKHAVRP